MTHIRNVAFLVLCLAMGIAFQPSAGARSLCDIDEPGVACVVGLLPQNNHYCNLEGSCSDTTNCFDAMAAAYEYCEDQAEVSEEEYAPPSWYVAWVNLAGFNCDEPAEPPVTFEVFCEANWDYVGR